MTRETRVSKIRPTQPVKLYSRAVVMGFRRARHIQYPNQSLLKIEGVQTKEDAQFYLGKRVAYIYKAHKSTKQGTTSDTKIRVIWGRVATTHGNSGAVRARFRNNLPPKAFGAAVRVMLYPSNV